MEIRANICVRCLATPTSREAFGRDVYDPDVELFHPTHEWQTVKQGEVMK